MNTRVKFPFQLWKEMSKYSENQKCCDCNSFDNSWASVSHGTLICIHCAGKHRSLGVNVSFVLSIHMDAWTPMQIECMKYGGNRKLIKYFEKLNWTNRTIVGYYDTEEFSIYRNRLRQRVHHVMTGNLMQPTISKVPPTAFDPECFLDMHIQVISIDFSVGPIGLTVIRGSKNLACVSHIVPEGPAYCNDVAIGDFLIGCNGCWGYFDCVTSTIQEGIHLPIQIHFARIVSRAEKKITLK